MQDAMAKCGATVSAQAMFRRRVGRFNERMTAAAADVAIVMASKFDHARGSTLSSIPYPSHHPPTTTFAVTPGTRSAKKSGGAMRKTKRKVGLPKKVADAALGSAPSPIG